MAGPTTKILTSDLKVKELTGGLRALRSEFAEFRGQVRTVFLFLKWLGSFLALTILGVIGALLMLTWYASKSDSRVAGLESAAITQSNRLDRLEKAAVGQSNRLDRLEQMVERLGQSVEKLVKATDHTTERPEANPTEIRETYPGAERVSIESRGQPGVK